MDPESGEYGEDRHIAIGKIDRQIYALVYTRRRKAIRVISFRKATAYERRRYREGA